MFRAFVFIGLLSWLIPCSTSHGQEREFDYSETTMLLHHLRDETFLKEIEAVDEQRLHISSVLKGMRQKVKHAWADRTLEPDQSQEITEKTQLDAFAEICLKLLPHQKKRLGQLLVQKKLIQRSGSYSRLVLDHFGEYLSIGDNQKDRLSEVRKNKEASLKTLVQEFESKIQEVIESEKNEVLELLDESQRAKLEDAIGEKFTGSEFGITSSQVIIWINYLIENEKK